MYESACAWDNCNETPLRDIPHSRSNSKYCRPHRVEAREVWSANREADRVERQARYEGFAALWEEAVKAAQEAHKAAIPQPMVVTQHENSFDDSSPVEQAWYVSEGACGFAWLTIRPGNTSFARWAAKNAGATKAYYGGLSIWYSKLVDGASQSYERHMAAMRAAAEVLTEGLRELDPKVSVYAGGRLD